VSRKKSNSKVSPDFLNQQKAALVRKDRQVVYFNEKETAAIDAYCKKFKVHSKGSALRGIIMEKVLSELEDNHPTLF